MRPILNTLWIEGPLSNIERICLASMLKQGHDVVLHTYGEVSNVPNGVIIKPASRILPFDDSFRHAKSGSIALFSDYFRFVLFKKEMGIWVDLDCYLLQPLELPSHGYLLGYEKKTINSAILHLPSDSPVLRDVLDACEKPQQSPYWLDFRRRIIKRFWYVLTGKRWHLGEMGWGIVGPVALTRLIPRYDLSDKVQKMKVFYPLDRHGSEKLYENEPFEHIINDTDIKSIHIYAKERRWETPVPGSFMEWATKNVITFLKESSDK